MVPAQTYPRVRKRGRTNWKAGEKATREGKRPETAKNQRQGSEEPKHERRKTTKGAKTRTLARADDAARLPNTQKLVTPPAATAPAPGKGDAGGRTAGAGAGRRTARRPSRKQRKG